MKKELIKLLRCPYCRKEELSLPQINNVDIDIREGFINCRNCKNSFTIKDGILDLLISSDSEIISEQKGWEELKEAIVNTDELMLSLPDAIGEHKLAWKSQAENFKYMFEKIDLSGKETILDLGSGRCWSTRFFARNGCYAVGIDILLAKYVGLLTGDIYIRNEGVYFERVRGNMNDLPFRDNIFDLVFITATLHHSSDVYMTLKEVHRVLKPTGRLILANEPVGGFKKNKLDCAEIKVGINEHVYRLWTYVRNLKKIGFTYSIFPYMGSYFPVIDKIKNILSVLSGKKSFYNKILLPLTYLQLLFFGGILNLIAHKRK
ncbi:MAG TPA: methyltransferase domain-containing protein [Candidatus Humimicrobiaceae bacterium]